MCHGLICVRRRYSKCYPSPTKSPLSLQHLASCRGGEHLLVWLPEFTCLSAKTYVCLPHKSVGSSDACVLTPQCRELRKLRADSAEGGAQYCFFELPHSGEPGPHHVPRIPVTCDPGNSSKLLGSSLSPRLIPITVGPAMNRSELGEM